jgi:hypothetical protein
MKNVQGMKKTVVIESHLYSDIQVLYVPVSGVQASAQARPLRVLLRAAAIACKLKRWF